MGDSIGAGSALQPVEYAAKVAVRAARSINDSVRALVRRPKSQAYLFSELRRRFPDRPEAELRAAVQALRRMDLQDPEPRPQSMRRPTIGREPSSDPIWLQRAEELGQTVATQATTEEALERAALCLNWDRNHTIQVLAAAEDAGSLFYDAPFWVRGMAKNVKTVSTVRELPCQLDADEALRATQRVTQIVLEKRALEAQIQSLRSQLRAKDAEFAAELAKASTRVELRNVQCEERYNYALGIVEVIRLDTKAVIDKRTMRPEERQLELGNGEGGVQ